MSKETTQAALESLIGYINACGGHVTDEDLAALVQWAPEYPVEFVAKRPGFRPVKRVIPACLVMAAQQAACVMGVRVESIMIGVVA